MNAWFCRVAVAALLLPALGSCRDGRSTDVGNELAFAWYGRHDYTNLYYGGSPHDGGVPVIPGGCDYAKWDDQYVLTKGKPWRYATWDTAHHIPAVPPGGFVYFVLEKKRYGGGQEIDPALHGPLTPTERAAWERRISGPYQEP